MRNRFRKLCGGRFPTTQQRCNRVRVWDVRRRSRQPLFLIHSLTPSRCVVLCDVCDANRYLNKNKLRIRGVLHLLPHSSITFPFQISVQLE